MSSFVKFKYLVYLIYAALNGTKIIAIQLITKFKLNMTELTCRECKKPINFQLRLHQYSVPI